MTVNHKDGNRLNNCIDNLEWVTREENIKYGFKHNQYPQKSITIYSTLDNQEYFFRSLSQASIFLGKNKGYLSNCIKNNKKIYNKNNIEYKIK